MKRVAGEAGLGRRASGLALLLLLVWPLQAFSLQAQSPNRECATCHIMWLLEFKREDVTPLVPFEPLPVVASGKQDVVSTDRMCLSCHDGFVLDSRQVWKNLARSHPVGRKPSPMTVIPTADGKEIFPLNVDGKVYCGTCHSAHGIDWNETESTIFLRMSNVDSQLCIACHFERSTGPEEGNHAIGQKLDEIPANLVSAGGLFSKSKQVICQSCHSVHGGRGEMLTIVDNRDSNLCVSCHQEKENVRANKHNLAVTAPQTRNLMSRSPDEAGPCSACHMPHNARGTRLWARSVADDTDFISSACLGCHSERGPAGEKAIGEQSHPINVPIENLGIEATAQRWSVSDDEVTLTPLPLFDDAGQRTEEGGTVTCLTCHDPHQWKHDPVPMSPEQILATEGDGTSSFLRIANDHRSGTCTYCHQDKRSLLASKHDMNVTAPGSQNKWGLGAAESGPCSACHLPHNGEGPRMWARVAAAGSGIEAQCRSCHQEGGAAENKLIGEHYHPLHVPVPEDARPVDLPLYDEEGFVAGEDGLVDCDTCHNPHEWSPSPLDEGVIVTAATEGHASTSFLRESAAKHDDTNLCATCHAVEAQIFGTDHDLAVSAPGATIRADDRVDETGPCGACHSVHNAIEQHRLWVRPFEVGNDVPEQLCRSCHREGGIAAAKVPDQLTHPDRTVPNTVGRERDGEREWENRPVFDDAGEKVRIGRISCLTCHNPHRWRPDSTLAGSGKPLEGDVMSSFLRHKQTENFLCADCHGEDALFRYKYFHWDRSRAEPRPRKMAAAPVSPASGE